VKSLVEALREAALLDDVALDDLAARLQVTLRGLDVRHLRPNAVVLLAGKARPLAEALSETIAASLFGSPDRVVAIDFARFTHHTDVTLLLGAPPGYVGYSDNLPLHRVVQTPWCVLRCENVDACHPQVLSILLQALADGFFTESRGKRVYLSDTVVVVTAGSAPEEARRPMGFGEAAAAPQPADQRAVIAAELGAELMAQCDVVVTSAPQLTAGPERVRSLLLELAERYRPQGLELQWDDSVVAWLATHERAAAAGARDWERLVDRRISSVLVPHLSEEGAASGALRLSYAGGTLQAERTGPNEPKS
jgi:ATP-dependent Clp protease ATP-binding subunit ClpC